MKIPFRSLTLALLLFVSTAPLQAREPSIDSLLKKLPPPEKILKNPAQRVLQQEDPAFQSPTGKNLAAAMKRKNYFEAVSASHHLTLLYPNSASVLSVDAALLLVTRQLVPARKDLERAVVLQPKFGYAWFLLGTVQAAQQQIPAALGSYQKFAALTPNSAVPFIMLSACEGRLGRKAESVAHAKKATVLAPALVYAWVELARAEKALGHPTESLAALARAADLAPDNAGMLATIPLPTST